MPHIKQPLTADRPLLDIEIGLSAYRTSLYQTNGLEVPSPVHVIGLIDTGASNSCIDTSVVNKLGITPIGTSKSFTASSLTIPEEFNRYDVSVIIRMNHPTSGITKVFSNMFVTEHGLSCQGIGALIGCDILRQGTLIFDCDEFTLSF